MDRNRVRYGLLAVVVWVVAAAAPASAATADAPRITKEEAKALLGAPNVVFVDARIPAVWNKSNQKIPGAVRADKWDLESWAASHDRDTTFIAY